MGNFGLKDAWATLLTANDSAAKEELGVIRYENDTTNGGMKVYKYVQAKADTTVANGTVLTYDNLYGTVVTSDISDTHQNRAAGVGLGAITASYYGWIQIRGYHSAVLTDAGDDIAAGDAIIVDPTVDGTCDSVAAGTAPTHRVVGWATTDDINAADTVATYLTCSD